MESNKALLSVSGNIADITGLVQTVAAMEGEEIKYRGCGVIIYRANHINGNAVIFLKYVGKQMIFGEWADIYTTSEKWKSWDYEKFTMKPLEHEMALIGGLDSELRKEFAI